MSELDAVLTFWFEPVPATEAAVDERMRFWFNGGPEVDQQVRERFGTLVERARKGELDAWTETPRGALGLILVLDQFPRNLWRGAAAAFESDARALELARRGFDEGAFHDFGTLEQIFAAMPCHHAEDVEDQKRGVALAVTTALVAEPPFVKFAVTNVDFARKHLDVIARFGRFPHRNATLGRESSALEREYLEYLTKAKQWL